MLGSSLCLSLADLLLELPFALTGERDSSELLLVLVDSHASLVEGARRKSGVEGWSGRLERRLHRVHKTGYRGRRPRWRLDASKRLVESEG